MSKTIIRIEKNSKNPYTMVHNDLLKDKNISWKAKGILAYLLSLPDDWKVYESELVAHATDGIGSLGSGITELIENNYIHRSRLRNEKGHLKGYKYSIYEVPTEIKEVEVETKTKVKKKPKKVIDSQPKEKLREEDTFKVDEDVKKIAKEYEKCGFGTIDIRTKELIEDLLEQFSTEWIVQAFGVCVEANKRTLKYAKGILNNWKTEGGMKLGGKNNGGSNGSSGKSKREIECEGDKLHQRAIEKYDIKPIADEDIDF